MPKDGHCEEKEFCSQHSGMKVMVWSILAGVICNLALLGYNTFGATAALRETTILSLSRLEGKVTSLEREDLLLRNELITINLRVDKIEK